MRLRATRILRHAARAACLAGLCATVTAAAEEPNRRPVVEAGAAFCLTRAYDRGHLAGHPRQLVASIRIMGRNAWRVDGEDTARLIATATVTFRDRAKPLQLYGQCFEKDETPGALKCGFVPATFQDVLGQTLVLQAAGDRVRATASADWRVIRAGREPDGAYGGPGADDAVFLLDRAPFSACAPSRRDWGPEGATPALRAKVP